jgi:hypothetical protein
VRVRITPINAIGTGVTQASGNFAVDNAGVVNTLTIDFHTDGNNDTINLVQSGSTITIGGTIAGMAVAGSATNMTNVTVIGGTGHNRLDASAMVMPVTLNGGNGSGADTLIGGAGSDAFYYSGNGSTYDGGGGANDEVVYPANSGDSVAVLGPALVVNDVSRNLGNVNRIEDFVVSGSPASVNNGNQRLWPLDVIPLTNAAISSLTVAPGSATTVLTAGFTDTNPRASTSTESAVIDWGDGLTSTGSITSRGSGNYTVTASHIYLTNATRPVVITIIDSLGAATTTGTNFTGGLELEANGDLRVYVGSSFTVPDSGVKSFIARNADTTLFTLHTDGSLFAIPGTSSKQSIDGGVQAALLGLDGVLYDLHGGGTLYTVALGSIQLHFAESNVQTLTQDKNGTLYKLHTDGSLYVLKAGSSWGQPVRQNVKSVAVTTDGAAVNVLGTDGNYWLFDGSAFTLLAGPHFVLSVPANATAGQTIAVTLSLLDALGGLVSGYTGTVQFASTDTQASLPPSYTFTAADAGVHTFNVILKTADAASLTATDTATPNRSVTQTGIMVHAVNAVRFVLSGYPSAITAGMAGSVTAAAYDAFGNVATGYRGTVHFTSSDSQAALPANYTFTAADGGVHTFMNVTSKTAAAQALTVTDTATASITGTQAGIVVAPAAASTLLVAGFPSPATAGVAGMVTVTARDAFGNMATGYIGTVHFTSSDPEAMLPNSYTFTAADMGIHTFSATFGTPGTQSLTATDAITASITGTQAGIVVSQSAPTSLVVAGFPLSITAGVAGTITVIARDDNGITVVGYRGTVHFSSSDGRAVFPGDYTFTATDAGMHTFTATLVTAGAQSITATDTQTASLTGTQTDIAVAPGMAVRIQVTTSVDSSGTVAGTPFDVTLAVQDAYGNIVTGYTGTVTFSSHDPYGAALPADYTFQPTDMGQATFSGVTTLYTAGVRDLTVVDTADTTLTGGAAVAVTPAPADHFQIHAHGRVSANTPFGVTVTALDPYGNIDVNYAGTVTFTTTDLDPNVVLPADYTFTAADGGVHTFVGGFSLVTLGRQLITATDTVSGITGSATVKVRPANTPLTGNAGRGSGNASLGIEASLVPTAGRVKSRIPMDQSLLLAEAVDCLFGGNDKDEWRDWFLADGQAANRS